MRYVLSNSPSANIAFWMSRKGRVSAEEKCVWSNFLNKE